jgi:hypothetical protein
MRTLAASWRLIILVLVTSSMALADAAGTIVTAEELFKWGEYDSIIRSLEPVVAAPGFISPATNRTDSADHAKSLLYLGVSYYAKGRTDRADTTLRSAFVLDPGLELDRFYVTPAIADHFQALKREAGHRNREGEFGAHATPEPPTGNGPLLQSRAGKSRVWLWWSIGAAAMTVAGGGAYWYAIQPGPPHPQVLVVDIRNKQ